MKPAIDRRLTLLRREKKISQRQAARDLGVSQALLSHYEKGARKPNLQFICDACDYYDVTADFLLGRSFARDGSVIKAAEVTNAAEEKDNVLRGLASTLMQKKLAVNSTSILFDVMDKTRDAKLIKAAANYLGLTYYKLYRYLYEANKNLANEAFAVPSLTWQQTADAQLKIAEAELCERIAALKSVPDVSTIKLSAEFPAHAPSLLTLLSSAGQTKKPGTEKS